MRMNGEIAIYSRKSKFTGKGESIGNQIELCKEYVRGVYGAAYLERCEVFEDEGFSGGNLQRPAFQEMMRQVRKKRYQAIVVYRLDRISRNISDFTGLIDELTKLGVSFVSIREQFDTSTPMGRAMMFIISVFSQLERETIAERIRDNMIELAKTGRWLGGNAPIGFQSEPVSKVTVDGKMRKSYQLVPIPEEAEIPKQIFDLYTKADSLTAVEAELLRQRIKTRQGKDFTRFSIKSILQNPVYLAADQAAYDYFAARRAEICAPREAFDGHCGIMAYHRTEQEKGKTTVLLPVSEWIIALGSHPGLVSSSQWIRVQESLERNQSKAYRKPRSNEALLTGLLFCSCGERMYPKLTKRFNANGEPLYSYVCKMKERSKGTRCTMENINGNLMDQMVMEQLKSLPEDPRQFAAQMEEGRKYFNSHRDQYETQLAKLRAEYTAREKIITGLLDALAEVEAPAMRASVLKRIEEHTKSNRETQAQMEELTSMISSEGLTDEAFSQLLRSMSAVGASINRMSLEERRNAIRTIVRNVVWDGETAHMYLFGDDGSLMRGLQMKS